MTLEDIVEKLFVDNPDLSEDEAVNKLKEMKDPKTNKSMWKAATIRNRVNTHLRTNKEESHTCIDESNKSPVETMGSESFNEDKKNDEGTAQGKARIESRIKDPFAIETDASDVGKKVDSLKDVEKSIGIDEIKMEIFDDVSQKLSGQISDEMQSFKKEMVCIVGDLTKSIAEKIVDINNSIKNMQSRGIATYVPVVEYDKIELKKPTIALIQNIIEERGFKEESDYIDSLIESEKEYISILGIYHKLVDLAREAKKGVHLRLFYENDKLSYDKKRVGRFGINLKNLLVGIGIGIAIGFAIYFLYASLTGTPATVPPIAP